MSVLSLQLKEQAEKIILDIFSMRTTSLLLQHFSPDQPFSVQHSYSTCSDPQAHRFVGRTAVRSYFDILDLYFEKSSMRQDRVFVEDSSMRVIVTGSVDWIWRASRSCWREELTCTVDFDRNLKIVTLVFLTTSDKSTCVMQAVDPRNSGQK
ncbi:hypothetical protein CPB85DRAFT_1316303 [Mucidula mucida]|nr:hypothetical protein CPB85DRAFT_1316303 [Mucidula mucida]